MRPYLYEMVDRIAGWGYTVLCPTSSTARETVAELAPTEDLRVPENRAAFFEVWRCRASVP